jgi:predicted ATPase
MTTPVAPFVEAVRIRPRRLGEEPDYTDGIAALAGVERLQLHPSVTFFVGDNGSGKSTLVEAIAVAAKMNAEGGGHALTFAFATRRSHSSLHRRIELEHGSWPPLNRFFLRAESVFNVATEVEREHRQMHNVFERPLHEQSHGESFLDIALNRFGPQGFYVLDEPEAALSVSGQLALLARMAELVGDGSQFVIATHSPILVGFPDARILRFGGDGIHEVEYDDAPQVELTRAFLDAPARYLGRLLA